ncbi:YceD family protein [Virgibacillus pantothenticus]|uniref:YceD family protein n=1 Tax=Virgibacillus pantothenticus TaxID=1473 RepID=UPI0027954348|nr:YceD family protein [Virgibacillus pantothenticus]
MMKFALAQLKKNAYKEPFTFTDTEDVSELEVMNNDIRHIGEVEVQGTCFFQEDNVIFSLRIFGEMVLPCARTLVDVRCPFDIQTEEIFTTSLYRTEDEIDAEIHPIEGAVLDLTPLIKENILLEVPYRVFSDEMNSQADCITEGKGWQFISEEKNANTIDERFKKLETLFKDNDKNK